MGKIIKEKTTEKWLGSIVNAAGIKESCVSTINERKFRTLNAINEIIAIVEDCRINRLGGLKCAKDIWEIAVLPALLNNSEFFNINDPKIDKLLEDFQSILWRGLLQVPKSCPLPSLTYESNSLLLKYRIYSKILNLTKHIHSHDQQVLSKQIMDEQMSNNWSGLVKQAKICSDELNLSGLFDQQVTKSQFKLKIKEACKKANDTELKRQIQLYKKMSAMKDEISKGNTYFFKETIQNARTLFRFRVELFEAKENFKNKYKNEGFLCDSCESKIDQNSHVLYCPSYTSLRKGKSLNSDSDLAQYLQK